MQLLYIGLIHFQHLRDTHHAQTCHSLSSNWRQRTVHAIQTFARTKTFKVEVLTDHTNRT